MSGLIKNKKFLVLLFLCVVIVQFVVFNTLGNKATNHIVYLKSIEIAQMNTDLVNLIGLPLSDHYHTSYSLRNDATAKYTIKIEGSKSEGSLNVFSEKEGEEWVLKKLELSHNSEIYNLLNNKS